VRRLALGLVLALLLTLLAGCLTGDEDLAGAQSEDSEIYTPEPDEDATQEPSPSSGSEDPLESTPRWQIGEHWTVRVTSTLLDGPVTYDRVVAGLSGQGYVVGQPADARSTAGLLLHVPGLGRVGFENLSYNVHGTTFAPVKFPLTEDRSWTTAFEGDEVEATVTSVDETTARVEFTGERKITLTYDAEINAVSKLEVDDGVLAYEVVDHGQSFKGSVAAPVDRQLVFEHGRAAGLNGFDGEPAAPHDNVTVPEGYDETAFLQIAGNTGEPPVPASGVYVERATSPNGTTYETRHLAAQPGLTITFQRDVNPNGTWELQHAAGGTGIAFTEGVAYRLFTAKLR
jgi:hypothetical protein